MSREVDHLRTFSAGSRALAPVRLSSDDNFFVPLVVVILIAVLLSQSKGPLTLQAVDLLLGSVRSVPSAQKADLFARLVGREVARIAALELDWRRRGERPLEDAFDLEISCVNVRKSSLTVRPNRSTHCANDTGRCRWR
jgi:hypothetical protein